MTRYAQYLRRELPSAVQLRLEIQIERMLQPVEEQLKLQLVEVVRDAQVELHRLYVERRRSLRQPTLSGTPPELYIEGDFELVQHDATTGEAPVAQPEAEEPPLVTNPDEDAPHDAPYPQDFDLEHMLNPVWFDLQDFVYFDFLDELDDPAQRDPNVSLVTEQEQMEALLRADADLDASIYDNGEGPSGTH